MRFQQTQRIEKPISEVFAFFSNPRNLEKITPAFLEFRITGMSTSEIQVGTLIDYRLKIHGVPVHWRTEITDWQPPRQFTDIQLKGPYRVWHHTHRFEDLGSATNMEDCVDYEVPGGMIGRWLLGGWIRKDIERIFQCRKEAIAQFL